MKKVYVDILANYTKDGQVIPITILWEDGNRYQIDKVLDVCRAASLKVGGVGLRYKCRIMGKEKFLFLIQMKISGLLRLSDY